MQSLVLLTIFSTEHVVVFLLVWTCLFWVCCWSDVVLVYHHCCLKCFAQIDFTQLKNKTKTPKALCGLFKCSRFAKPRVEGITTYFFRLIDGSNKQGGSWHLPAAKIVDLFLFAVILPHIHASLKLDRWLYACCFFTSKILCRKCIV